MTKTEKKEIEKKKERKNSGTKLEATREQSGRREGVSLCRRAEDKRQVMKNEKKRQFFEDKKCKNEKQKRRKGGKTKAVKKTMKEFEGRVKKIMV